MGRDKLTSNNMLCEFSHQTGLMNAKDVEWMIGDRKSCCDATAVCITKDPKYCAEKSCLDDGGWDKITAVYFSRDFAEAKELKDSLAENRWKTISSCSQGKEAPCSAGGYFVCVLSQGCECD